LQFAGLGAQQIDQLTQATAAYARATVYELGDVRSITAQLAANGVPGFQNLAMALGNLNAVSGGTSETFRRVGQVLTQTAGIGKLTTENWMQFSEAIPGAAGRMQQELQKAGAFTGNFRTALAQGQISAQDFGAAIQNLGFDKVAQQAATSTKTFEGAAGGLRATIVDGLAESFNTLKPGLTGFINLLSGAAKPALDALGKGAQAAAPYLETFVKAMSGDTKIGQFSGSIGKFNDAILKIKGTVGPVITSISSAFDKLSGNQKAMAVLTGLGAAFGAVGVAASQFLGPLKGLLGPLGGFGGLLRVAFGPLGLIVGLFATAWNGSEQFRNAIMGLVDQFAPLISVLGQNIQPVLGAVSGLMGVAAGVVVNLATAIAPLITTLGAALAPILTTLVQTLFPILASTLTQLGPIISGLGGFLTGLVSNIMGFLIPAIQTLTPIVTTVFQGLGTIIQGALNVVMGIINTVMSLLKGDWQGAWDGLKQIVTGVWDVIKGAVTTAINVVKGILSAAWNGIKTGAQAAWNAVSKGISDAWNAITNAIGGAINGIKNTISNWLTNAKNTISNAWNSIVNGVKQVWTNLGNTVRTGVTKVVDFVKELPGNIVRGLGNMGNLLVDTGRDLVQGMINGVKNAVGGLVDAAKNMVGSAINAAKSVLGIDSPSKVFALIGKQAGQGLVLGLNASQAAAARAGASLTRAATPSSPTINGSRSTTVTSRDGSRSTSGVSDGGQFVYAPQFYGPTTGSARLRELDWARRYAPQVSAPRDNSYPFDLSRGVLV